MLTFAEGVCDLVLGACFFAQASSMEGAFLPCGEGCDCARSRGENRLLRDCVFAKMQGLGGGRVAGAWVRVRVRARAGGLWSEV